MRNFFVARSSLNAAHRSAFARDRGNRQLACVNRKLAKEDHAFTVAIFTRGAK